MVHACLWNINDNNNNNKNAFMMSWVHTRQVLPLHSNLFRASVADLVM